MFFKIMDNNCILIPFENIFNKKTFIIFKSQNIFIKKIVHEKWVDLKRERWSFSPCQSF